MDIFKLDKKDKKILSYLDMNARIPITQLCKNVQLSRQGTEYRIKRLEEKKIILGYYAVTDPVKLGYWMFRLRIKYRSVNKEKENEIFEYCKTAKGITWAAKLEGKWNLILIILAKNPIEYKSIEQEFTKYFGTFIQDTNESIATRIVHLDHSHIHGKKTQRDFQIGKDSKLVSIDETDRVILALLADKGNMQVTEMQKSIKLTSNAISYRIRKLEAEGIILGYRTIINYKALGFQHYKVYLYLINLENLQKIMNYLSEVDKVVFITLAIGEGDLEFEIQVKNSHELYEFLDSLSILFPDEIKDYYTLLLFREIELKNQLPKPF